jgi:hypothetical protein
MPYEEVLDFQKGKEKMEFRRKEFMGFEEF